MDFDGVIVDSADEGLFTAFCAYKKLNPKTGIFGGNLKLHDFKTIIKKYKSQYKRFRTYRTYLRTALDYYYILYFIDQKINIKNSSEFEKELKKVPADKKKFIEEFYGIRDKLMREYFEEWVKLEHVYPHMTNLFSKLQDNIYISTSNRKSTILKTFSHFGMKIDPLHIFDNTASLDKKEHIKQIKEIENVDYSDITFVDDQLNHFYNLRHLRINCILAGWGYINGEQIRKARRIGIKIATTNNLINIIGIK